LFILGDKKEDNTFGFSSHFESRVDWSLKLVFMSKPGIYFHIIKLN